MTLLLLLTDRGCDRLQSRIRTGGCTPIVPPAAAPFRGVTGMQLGSALLAASAARRECTRDPSNVLSRAARSEEHTSELQSHLNLVCRLLLEKKKKTKTYNDK